MIDDEKSRAYLVYEEWGPDATIPRETRMADQFPAVPGETMAAWVKEFGAVGGFVWGVAEQGAQRTVGKDEFVQRLRESFPFMNDAAADKAWFLANYYAWHEGYM